ncbi:MAG: FmdB family zinc ribbon protein [Acidimicrobiales bacterium]
MPTYEYECHSCHRRVEAVQKFTDPALTVCESCGGELRKVFSAPGIAFKGSGFYKNDSRSSGTSSATTPSPTKTEGASESSAAPTPTPTPTKTESPAASSTPAASSSD